MGMRRFFRFDRCINPFMYACIYYNADNIQEGLKTREYSRVEKEIK
jgi:hypothetical protein